MLTHTYHTRASLAELWNQIRHEVRGIWSHTSPVQQAAAMLFGDKPLAYHMAIAHALSADGLGSTGYWRDVYDVLDAVDCHEHPGETSADRRLRLLAALEALDRASLSMYHRTRLEEAISLFRAGTLPFPTATSG